MDERKIIFKAKVGSHLHGTATEKSDDDFLGVFIPSQKDLLGLQNRPSEWSENVKVSTSARNQQGDTDCKYLALYEFFNQAAKGQSQALELLFIPEANIVTKTVEWDTILANKELFITQKGILPIIGFAVAQMNKATIKGSNLNKINALIVACDERIAVNDGREAIVSCVEWPGDFFEGEPGGPNAGLFGLPVRIFTNLNGYKMIEIAGRDYDIGLSIKRFRHSLDILEKKYGSRVRLAAQMTYDFKSLTHAFRLISQAEEFIQNGTITFPRPDVNFLLKVKQGLYEGNVSEEINGKLDNLKQNLIPKSSLKPEPDYSKIDKLCTKMLADSLGLK